MKRLFATILLLLVSFAANAEAETVISIVCKGSRTVKISYIDPPKQKWDSDQSIDIATVYVFRVEKNPTNNDALEWSMQRNEEQKQYQQDKPRESFHIWVTDQLITVLWNYKNDSGFKDGAMRVNRLTGNWHIKDDDFNDKFFNRNENIGTCEAATKKF